MLRSVRHRPAPLAFSNSLSRRVLLGNPLPFADPLGKVGTNSVSWGFQRNNEGKKERDVQSRRARGVGHDGAGARASAASRESTSGCQPRGLRGYRANAGPYQGEGAFVDDEAETAWKAEHLEATLVDVRDILGGASEDVRGLLE